MCREFLTNGYEGATMAKMLDCHRACKGNNVIRIYTAEDLKIIAKVGQRYVECGWLEKEDEVKLEELWQKTKSNVPNRRRLRKEK